MCWAIWRSRNDTVFQKTKNQTSLQIIFMATYLTRACAILHKEEDREAIAAACRMLETVAMDLFATNGWMFSNRFGLESFPLLQKKTFVIIGRIHLH